MRPPTLFGRGRTLTSGKSISLIVFIYIRRVSYFVRSFLLHVSLFRRFRGAYFSCKNIVFLTDYCAFHFVILRINLHEFYLRIVDKSLEL